MANLAQPQSIRDRFNLRSLLSTNHGPSLLQWPRLWGNKHFTPRGEFAMDKAQLPFQAMACEHGRQKTALPFSRAPAFGSLLLFKLSMCHLGFLGLDIVRSGNTTPCVFSLSSPAIYRSPQRPPSVLVQ
jgi:hypothetical protein